MQATAMLRAGLSLPDQASLALASASHLGEPMHVSRVRSLLASAGLVEEALACPPDLPVSTAARNAVVVAGGGPERVYMNCSGKHTGMLLTCLAAGWPTAGYTDPGHPLQVVIRSTVEELAGEAVPAAGVDGCGAPVLALSLVGLARAYLGLVDSPVADAMRAYPELVSGTGADDARLMRGLPGIMAKGGAEGVLAAALRGVGAVAMKIDDGAKRARLPVLASALRRLGVEAPILAELAEDAEGVVQLGGGQPVGTVRPVW
jgi:L-asparaginase II